MGPKVNRSTWEKLLELEDSEQETDRVYAEMLATAIEIRLESGLTQTMLAKKAGLASGMISKMESGSNQPTIKTFLKYLRGLEIDWVLMQKKGT